MWQVIVLVCALHGPCDEDTARAVVPVPEAAPGPALCGLVGQAYVARTGLVGPDDRVKMLYRGRAPQLTKGKDRS